MQTMRRRHDARYGVEPGLTRLRRELAIRPPTPNDVNSHFVIKG